MQEITGIPGADLEAAAEIYGEAGEASILWGLGVTEHRYGSEVAQLICNLALMTGKVGRPGSALLPLRGQNNVQGSSDMGALPDTYSGYRPVGDEAVARDFEQAWGVPLSRTPGMKIPQMFDAAVAGELKAMFIFGEDVAQTDPNTTHVVRALEALEFLVCQDIFETETTAYADVVLPASSFLEKAGTFTNAERRIQLVAPAIEPPGEARTDFDILTGLSRALGHDMGLETPADAMREIAALTPEFAGVTYERLGRRGLQWPVAPDGSDAPILYRERFQQPGGRAHFAALPYKEPGDAADEEFPLVLITGRRLEHYNAGTMTRRTAQPRTVPGRLAGAPSAGRRAPVGRRRRSRVGAQPRRADRGSRADHRPDRARARLHRLPLPGGAHEPARRLVRRRQHVVPGVQGRRGRRAPRPRGAVRHPGAGERGLRRMTMADRPAAHMVATVDHDGISDAVAVEEPLEIRVDGTALAITMRTPGQDEELALGFLVGEGLLDPLAAAPAVGLTDDLAANIIDVRGPLLREPPARRFYTTSSCGICGKGALEEVAVLAPVAAPGPVLSRARLGGLPSSLTAGQPAFAQTGGMHATGLFTVDGALMLAREDVGRHNAMDKVIGRALIDGLLPLHGHVLCVSGRLSFELVQKAAVAGVPILVGVGAPSSLAIALAADRGMTLCGFARAGDVNVYSAPERVA